MQLFKKRKIVSELFAPFVESKSDFENFQKKKMTLIDYVFPKLRTAPDVVR